MRHPTRAEEYLFHHIPSLRCIVAEGDYIIVHGRFTGYGRPIARIASDIVRIENGCLAEHWMFCRMKPIKAESKSGLLMFGDHSTAFVRQSENQRNLYENAALGIVARNANGWPV